jgi:hypothetical protein
MKQRASDVLSLGGLQKDENGNQLRKRKEPDGDQNTSSSSSSRTKQTSSQMSGNGNIVCNINFNNCTKMKYITHSDDN